MDLAGFDAQRGGDLSASSAGIFVWFTLMPIPTTA